MKNKITFIIIFISSFCSAQLSVRNDYDIFVSNQILFVEDDINLNEANSKILLRNEAQVIQGTGNTGNSGEGELSVFQDGNVGPYAYNYWCSPIGDNIPTAGNSNFGISLLNDIIDIENSTPASFNETSDSNGTANPLNIHPYWIWKFIASDEYSEWIHVHNTTTLLPGEGFTMKGTAGTSINNPGNNQNYDFRGKPNTGNISVSVLPDQITLVGNPYPSAMDAAAYIHDPINSNEITGTLYFWEQDQSINSHILTDYSGGYGAFTISPSGVYTYVSAVFSTYNALGVINTTAGFSTSGKSPRRYIPIGQGFMVEGASTATASSVVTAKNEHRVFEKESGTESEFFRSSNSKKAETTNTPSFSIVPNDYKRFRLNVDFNEIYTRQISQTFHASATTGFDYGLDIKTSEEDALPSDVYWESENIAYLAEALAYNDAIKIPLTIKIENSMLVRIRITDIQNFNSDSPIYVHDKINETYTNLKLQNFEINLDKGKFDNRFEITFIKENTLSTVDNSLHNFKVFQNNNTSQLSLLNFNDLDIKSLSLFDVSGKQVMKHIISSNNKQYNYSTKSLSEGVYIVKIDLNTNKAFSKKIIISSTN